MNGAVSHGVRVKFRRLCVFNLNSVTFSTAGDTLSLRSGFFWANNRHVRFEVPFLCLPIGTPKREAVELHGIRSILAFKGKRKKTSS